MNTRMCPIALFGVVGVLVSTMLVSFDRIEVRNTINQHDPRLKNETLVALGKEGSRVIIPIPGAVGPESLAFGGRGGPYTGVSDGRVIRWLANESRWVDFAVTSSKRDGCVGPRDHTRTEHICGRPLGLGFNDKTGQVYIADAYMGLLVVGPDGGRASPVATEVDGVAFGFTNALDIDQSSGVVYFTDSSTRFTRRNYVSVIVSGDDTGRLVKFDPKTNETTLVVDNLKFPNGIALSQNGEFLLFAETTTCRLFKLWLDTRKLEVLDQLPGFPDNIKRNKDGEFWVGINSRRGKLLEWLVSNPWIGNFIVRVSPVDLTRVHSCLASLIGRSGMGIKLDRDGNVAKVLDVGWKFVSEIEEERGELWIGSVTRDAHIPFSKHFPTPPFQQHCARIRNPENRNVRAFHRKKIDFVMASSMGTGIGKLLNPTKQRRFAFPLRPGIGSPPLSTSAAVTADPQPGMLDMVKEYVDYRRSLYGGLTHKALLVDAVGTLVVPSQPMAQIYGQIGEKYGVEYSELEILNRYRRAYEQPWGRSRLRYVRDGRPFWQYIVSSSTGCSDTHYFEELYSYYTTEKAWHLCDPEAEQVFQALRKAGVKVAIVSNFDTRLRPLLRALKCDHWFDALAVSAEVEAEKPNPMIFLKACEFLGVQPEDAVHVGDDRRNDIWGARDAGCDAWLWGSDVNSFKEIAQRIGVEV